ncbi:MAG: rRNA maturation RNAse YbeY, partial [Nitrospirae bacterium]|nr:rRNA maturation RNAse YbeY [Nitrospirota bacterium]
MAVEIRNLQRKFRVPVRALQRGAVITLQGFRIPAPELSILLVNDRRIRGLNRQYRKIDKATDVLAFSMREG